MPERSVAIRLAVEDAAKARQRLLELGDEGQQALAKIEAAGPAASASLGRLDSASGKAGRAARGLGDDIAGAARDIAAGRDPIEGLASSLAITATQFGLVGIAIGVGVAALGSLYSSLTKTTDATKEAAEATKELEGAQRDLDSALDNTRDRLDKVLERFNLYTEAQRTAAGITLAESIRSVNKELEAQQAKIGETINAIEAEFSGAAFVSGLGIELGLEGDDPLLNIFAEIKKFRESGDADASAIALRELVRALGGGGPEAEKFAQQLSFGVVESEALRAKLVELAGEQGILAYSAGLKDVIDLLAEFEQNQKGATTAAKNFIKEVSFDVEAERRIRQLRSQQRVEKDIAAASIAAEKEAAAARAAAARQAEADLKRIAQEREKAADREIANLKEIAREIDRAEDAKARDSEQRQAEIDRQAEAARAQLARDAEANQRALEQPFLTFLESAQQATTTFWEDFYSGGIQSAEDVTEAIKDLFVRLAAELTSLAIFRGISGQGMGGLGGFFGGWGGAAGVANPAAGGTATGPGGMLVGGGATSSMGAPAASRFGFTGAGVATGGLLGAGFGAAGASLFGASQNATIGATLGGALGGAGGSFFGPFGMIGGGMLGSAAGGLLGSLFGGDDEDKIQGSFRGAIGRSSFQGDRAVSDFIRGIDDQILSLLDTRQRQIVQDFETGGRVNVKGGLSNSDKANLAAGRIGAAAGALGFRRSAIMQGGADQSLQNLQTAIATQRAIEELTDSISPLSREIRDTSAQFVELRSQGRRFGISIEGLAEAQTKAVADLRRAGEEENRARIEQRRAIEEQGGALLDPFDQLIKMVEDVQRGAEFAGVSPAQQFEKTRAEFERIAAEALGGSTEAIGQFGAISQAFAQQSQQFGAGPGLVAATERIAEVAAQLRDDIIGSRAEATRGVEDVVERWGRAQVDTLREMVERADEQIRVLIGIERRLAR